MEGGVDLQFLPRSSFLKTINIVSTFAYSVEDLKLQCKPDSENLIQISSRYSMKCYAHFAGPNSRCNKSKIERGILDSKMTYIQPQCIETRDF
jgi:hypothetical protein